MKTWHDDEWFAERGFPPPATEWARTADEGQLRSLYESVANAPPFSPQQQIALRRIFGAIRRQMEASAAEQAEQAERAAPDPPEPEQQ